MVLKLCFSKTVCMAALPTYVYKWAAGEPTRMTSSFAHARKATSSASKILSRLRKYFSTRMQTPVNKLIKEIRFSKYQIRTRGGGQVSLLTSRVLWCANESFQERQLQSLFQILLLIERV